ncbi:globin [Photobacterium proteolyticum]|uniref:Globin n=1 Tax=Photobacterium proteolyticum TaxID=1903952 RepID=A0A1Q9GG43_9GAMM|nr:group II truncated hemoglobin [Photobacterium proteolyticum]OLQ73373.1 globin [Photobacterium proteolyticum]
MKPQQEDISAVSKPTAPVYGVGDSTLQAAGGEAGVKKLVEAFYEYMDTLPEAEIIRAMHAEDLTESREKLTTFLVGWMGGPSRYSEKYGSMNIPGAHRHLAIGVAEKEAWLLCMQKALDDQGYEEVFKRYVMVQLSFPAEMCRNR